MKSKVYYIKTSTGESIDNLVVRIRKLLDESKLLQCVSASDKVAVKMHFGEKGNTTYIQPGCVRPIIDALHQMKAKPFLTDTCVLYKSSRDNAVDHLKLAYAHGFTMDMVDAPVIITDGLLGSGESAVLIPGEIFHEVSIANAALEANSMIVLSHITGHICAGMGGAIKNLGMGLSSRKGKLRQHSVMRPDVITNKCTGCDTCVEHCPEEAISMQSGKAMINSQKCIGCGECLAVCRFYAIEFDFSVESALLQKRMTEHALGAVIQKKDKVGYINFCINVTKDCDCISLEETPVIPDIGIFAGADPVALDAVCLDTIKKQMGNTLESLSYPHLDARIQIEHGEKIGLGSSEYELIEVS